MFVNERFGSYSNISISIIRCGKRLPQSRRRSDAWWTWVGQAERDQGLRPDSPMVNVNDSSSWSGRTVSFNERIARLVKIAGGGRPALTRI